MAKGVYRRYRGSRTRKGMLVPTLVVLCIIAAAVLIYVNFNLEDGGDGTTVLSLPFTDEKITFGEPQKTEPATEATKEVEEVVVEEEVKAEEVNEQAPEYETRIEKPAFLTLDEDFDENLAKLEGVNTVVLKYKYDSGEIVDFEEAKEACAKITDAGFNACAMISCFRDNEYASEYKDYACLKKNKKIWKDGDEYAWLNPYSAEAADYVCSVIGEAKDAGFKEVLLTNVAFPMSNEIYYNEETEKGGAISAFLAKVNEMCGEDKDFRAAVYFDGKDNGQDIKIITEMFYRVYTRDTDIYNKVETLIPENKLEQRIVNLAENQ